jgi:hypothetical protein
LSDATPSRFGSRHPNQNKESTATAPVAGSFYNGTVHFLKCKQLFEYHIYSHLDISGG